METLTILKKLISIPSFVDSSNSEESLSCWIYDYLIANSKLTVTKQYVTGKRFNIIASNSKNPTILVSGHIDTVEPSTEWKNDPFKPIVTGNKLYGLGASDMKCGIATMLSFAIKNNLKPNILFLFYIDEEYDFLGMKKFITVYKNKIKPKLIISLDGENLQIENTCRGLIEMKVSVSGKAGHSANPSSGTNAITQSFKVISYLNRWLKSYKTKALGNSTLNIAFINGGGSEGNIIAEKCVYIVEIRVANEKLDAELVKKFITETSERVGLKVVEIKVRHDLGSWITPKAKLKKLIMKAPKKILKNVKKGGYIDIQMLWDTFSKVPTFSFGAGVEGMAHKADEYVKISSLETAESFFSRILLEE